MKVVVVESPAKAKTINKYLGDDYKVIASYGHVRDLPAKDGSVQPDADFAMSWEVDGKSEKHMKAIVQAMRGADGLFLATDPDREGEAISWHVQEVLKSRRALKDVDVKRVVFNEVTRNAVVDAFRRPREIDRELVEAYLARRALDYLVGFTLSPVLWRKLPGKPLGRPGAVRRITPDLRARSRDRGLQAARILDSRGHLHDRARTEFHRATDPSRRQTARPIRTRQRGQSARRSRRDPGRGGVRRCRDRQPATPAQSFSAVYDVDIAAGGFAQTWSWRDPHDADRAAALRGHRSRQ